MEFIYTYVYINVFAHMCVTIKIKEEFMNCRGLGGGGGAMVGFGGCIKQIHI